MVAEELDSVDKAGVEIARQLVQHILGGWGGGGGGAGVGGGMLRQGAKSKCGMKREEARLPPWKRVGEHTVEGTGAGGTLSATATTMWGQEQPEEKKPASVT